MSWCCGSTHGHGFLWALLNAGHSASFMGLRDPYAPGGITVNGDMNSTHQEQTFKIYPLALGGVRHLQFPDQAGVKGSAVLVIRLRIAWMGPGIMIGKRSPRSNQSGISGMFPVPGILREYIALLSQGFQVVSFPPWAWCTSGDVKNGNKIMSMPSTRTNP